MAFEDELADGKIQLHSRRLGRELAMQFLFQNDLDHEEVKPDVLDKFFENYGSTFEIPENRNFRKGKEYAAQLINGVIEHHLKIDDTLKHFSEKWDIARMSIVDRNIMRVSIYEMLFVADVPPIVSINEAVGIARDYSGDKSGNFINGVLNGLKDTLTRPARDAVKEL
ncbi:MAG: transcription antitermination factor NusB [Victivallaceae bacterium]|jgi:N utilization substance protein B|nr:transcription antitermination factor NusB [Victivallaceae bacterium]NLK83033.1 transcription antitermination factor NusB [Lentisphaerota bacterium]MDD3116706.1 transcription antitermination factor NusB [Victivallaceae bacterium]MDD3702898.1 transcription antitermination factor NusB [Victivallaceae bacterium]MDD4317633.1 transcription antitermination factor NusB [Victivallaceae bacterium]